jgi:CRISPR-associated endonuclease/helicase Cas3
MMSNKFPEKLLAKSQINGKWLPGCFLVTHSLDVLHAVESVLDTVGADLIRFFKLQTEQADCLKATSRLAGLWHDTGKANDDFQKAVTVANSKQAIRHEHLSTLLMSLPDVKTWLSTAPNVDYEIARLVVLCHHLKAVGEDSKNSIYKFGESLGREFQSFNLCSKHSDTNEIHPDFMELLSNVQSNLLISKEPDFNIPQKWSFKPQGNTQAVRELARSIKSEFGNIMNILESDPPRLRLLWATKAILFAADAAASGLRRVDEIEEQDWHPEDWIRKSLLQGCKSQDIEEIIEKRKAEVIRRKHAEGIKDFVFIEQPFQVNAATVGERALLLAPCGSGKTLAAYIWIKEQLKSRQGYKAVFLYPTTGTASEGFKDYASHNPKAALVHSRAEFDLEDMFENPDERNTNQYSTDKKKRLYALGFWGDAIFSATADAFFSFVQNNYSSLCLLPVLARSVIVVDEIHSFDSSMFSELIKFLQEFNVPVLMMTASLQKNRRLILEKEIEGLRIYPNEKIKEDEEVSQALKNSADAERYRINLLPNTEPFTKEKPCPQSLLDLTESAFNNNRKVLWVVNTVDRCIAIAQMLEKFNVLCYHSRFMYIHRVKRHKAVVKAFQDRKPKGVIAVTTQVCEMSLDLDADVLITELAPAPSLIQRMGRCNRATVPRPLDQSGEVYIYEPLDKDGKPNGKPYLETIYATGNQLLASQKIDLSVAVSQEQLTQAMDEITFDKERTKACLFMLPTWEAYSRNDYRDIDDFAVSAVLESQVKSFQKRKKQRKPTAGLLLQAPKGYVAEKDGMWFGVVNDISEKHKYHYCEKYGLRKLDK